MNKSKLDDRFDCIIIGSGTAGATLARELSKKGQRVLMLERGKYRPLKETLWSLASMFNEVKVAAKLKDARVFTAGGSSAMYLAMMDEPPIEAFRVAGIDLSDEYEAVRRELPLAEMPDELLSPQALRLREAAVQCGHDWRKRMMLIDQSACSGVYSYEAKWKALTYVDDAVRFGTTLQCQARVERVLIDDNQAVGVECRVSSSSFGSRLIRYQAEKVVVAAGSLATPIVLRNSGLLDIATKGYYIDPSLILFGRVSGLQGRNGFAGAMYTTLEDGTSLQDANVHKLPFNMFMAATLRPLRMFSYPEHIGIMVKAHDAVGGSLSDDGRYHKELDSAVLNRLKRGEEAAHQILQRAGAKKIFKAPMMTGGALGTIHLSDDVDLNLQTSVRGLHVCDGSLIPHNGRVAPTLTLVCLARYLAGKLAAPADIPANFISIHAERETLRQPA